MLYYFTVSLLSQNIVTTGTNHAVKQEGAHSIFIALTIAWRARLTFSQNKRKVVEERVKKGTLEFKNLEKRRTPSEKKMCNQLLWLRQNSQRNDGNLS